MGSNPILSARFVEKQNELIIIIIQVIGEVPKRLKGLPWKGSRSLIAARGFKSLFLRLHSRDFYCVFLRFFGGHAIMHGSVKWHFAERLYSLSGV